MYKPLDSEVLFEISEAILVDENWSPKENPIEFDRNRDDSQIVFIQEDLEKYTKYLYKWGYSVVKTAKLSPTKSKSERKAKNNGN
jgi:hypothetical protein